VSDPIRPPFPGRRPFFSASTASDTFGHQKTPLDCLTQVLAFLPRPTLRSSCVPSAAGSVGKFNEQRKIQLRSEQGLRHSAGLETPNCHHFNSVRGGAGWIAFGALIACLVSEPKRLLYMEGRHGKGKETGTGKEDGEEANPAYGPDHIG